MTVQKGGWDFFQEGNAAMGDASGNPVTDSSGNPAANTIVANHQDQIGAVTVEGTAAGSAAEVAATLTDVTPYNVFMLHVVAVTTSIDITVSLDGTDFSSNVVLIDQSTEAPFATAAITATGVYKLSGKFKAIKITSVGAGAYDVNYLLGTK